MDTLFIPGLGNLGEYHLVAVLLVLLGIVWTLVWKGVALWVAARENSKPWFIVLLIINTAGILEIVYLLFFSKAGGEYLSKWRAKRSAQQKEPAETTEQQG